MVEASNLSPENYRLTHGTDWYFPITRLLTEAELKSFDELIQSLCREPNFDLRLLGENRSDQTSDMPIGVARLVAGQLAEIFYFRRDILEYLLTKPLRIWLYSTPRAYKDDGGVAGGQYDDGRKVLQLVLSRLFEGNHGETPGVAPFLHELGHLLNFFGMRFGILNKNDGLLPGLRPKDGPIYVPTARKLFLKGKSLELQRYLAFVHGTPSADVPLPIGHPYVFQNDTEFTAGYFEMFFRNPNYFAAQNIDLYQSFTQLFGYDPRQVWPNDFLFYIEGNRKFYLSGQKPPKPGITVPKR